MKKYCGGGFCRYAHGIVSKKPVAAQSLPVVRAVDKFLLYDSISKTKRANWMNLWDLQNGFS